MNNPLFNKAIADFAAGKKDEAAYMDTEGGRPYRDGWRFARLEAEKRADSKPLPPDPLPEIPPKAPDPQKQSRKRTPTPPQPQLDLFQ